jgi:catechol 2,3-dioxygenase-like lactoylglutathione lyase family enzyme
MAVGVQGLTTLLEVYDMDASLAFYRDLLGFEVVHSWGLADQWTWVRLKAGESSLMLNSAYDDRRRPGMPDEGRVKGHVDTELYFQCVDADQAYTYLRGQGCDVKAPVVTYYGMKQVWLQDPDGFQVCLQSPSVE